MAKQPRILTGQVAAITGGARGIGRAMAETFLREGMRVAIGDVDVETARQTASELGRGTVAFELDVPRRESVEAFADAVERELGPIDVFVNNAGIMPVGRFIDEDDASAHRQVDINVHGVIYGCKVALSRMLPRNRGHIVNVASQAGKFGVPASPRTSRPSTRSSASARRCGASSGTWTPRSTSASSCRTSSAPSSAAGSDSRARARSS